MAKQNGKHSRGKNRLDEVDRLVSSGMSRKSIAAMLNISTSTVGKYARRLETEGPHRKLVRKRSRWMWCSRFSTSKEDAKRDSNWLARNGADHISIYGTRGAWRVRALVDVTTFARFVSIEAKR